MGKSLDYRLIFFACMYVNCKVNTSQDEQSAAVNGKILTVSCTKSNCLNLS